MNTQETEFLAWLNTNAKRIENTEDKFVFNDKVYTEKQLLEHFTGLKITEVDILGYDRHFTIKLYGENYLTLDQVISHVSKEIVDTAIVKQVRHMNWLNNRNIYIDNPAYSDRSFLYVDGLAKMHLKNNIKITQIIKI